MPRHDDNSPGPFYYADPNRLVHDLEGAGFNVEHLEVVYVDVMEATSDTELVDWARTFGMSRLLQRPDSCEITIIRSSDEFDWQQLEASSGGPIYLSRNC